MKKLILISVLTLAGCGTIAKVFTPDPATGETPAGGAVKEIAPFLPAPWGALAVAAVGALTGAGGTHTYHKRKQKRAAAAVTLSKTA